MKIDHAWVHFPRSKSRSIPRHLSLDATLGAIIGRYVAEGDYSEKSGQVRLSFHTDERDEAVRIAGCFKHLWDVDASIRETKGNWINLDISCRVIGRLLSAWCGKGARNKHLPEFIWNAPEQFRAAVIRDLFGGDGHVDAKREIVQYTTTSDRLAFELNDIILSLGGDAPSWQFDEERHSHEMRWQFGSCLAVDAILDLPERNKGTHATSIPVDEGVLKRIQRIDTRHYVGPVYNLEVEGNQSYVANGIAVHNCITAMETAAAGVRGITSPLAALNETAVLSDFIDVGEATSTEYAQAFLKRLSERLADPAYDDRQRAMRRAWEWYEWRLVAAEWSDLFNERLEQRRLERTKSSSQAETDVTIVVPYGWSGGVQYPLELGREFARRGLRVKKWMVAFGGEADLSPHLPVEPDFEVVDFQTFRARADEVLDTKNVIVVNWQTHEALRAIGADARDDLNRINLVQGDERKWAPVERIASMMNDSTWQIVYASKYLADTMQVPGRIVPDGIPTDTMSHGDPQCKDDAWAGLLAHASPIKNTDAIIKASADPAWPQEVNLIVLVGEEAERQRIAAMPEWIAETGAGIREMRQPLVGDMFSRDEVLAAMENCGHWFVPSLEEGFGLVGLEAMACGCCVLTSAVGGMVTYTNRHNAVAVRNLKNPDAWAKTLEILHGMPANERTMMRQLAKSTAAGYTIDHTAEIFLREIIRL